MKSNKNSFIVLAALFATLLQAASPTITSTAVTAGTQGAAYSYTLSGSDADANDVLAWSEKTGTTLPSWLSFTSSTNVSTFAGNATPGILDGNGTDATFNKPTAVAVDSNGTVYVADKDNHLIRKITSTGEVSTFAGNGTAGSDNNVTGTAASFNQPRGIAVDSNGIVYVADTQNSLIRKITPDGEVSTLAGGTYGNADGNIASATFGFIQGVTVDSNNNVYVVDNTNRRIRKITPEGIVSNLAGSGNIGTQNGTGITANFSSPQGITTDSSGNVYVTEGIVIKKITPAGVVTTFAGSQYAGAVDGNVTVASFNTIMGIAIDRSGNAYVADEANNRIRKITSGTKLSGTPTNADVGDHNVSLTLSDGTNEDEQSFIITVANINDAPTDITLSTNAIGENNVVGAIVGTISTTDIDANETFTYSFCAGADNASFTIDGSSLKANAVFDFETKSSYSVCIRTTDSGNVTFDKTITINITDGSDYVPQVTSSPVTTSTLGAEYSYTLTGSDADANSALTWSVKDGTSLPAGLTLTSGANVSTLAGSATAGSTDATGVAASFNLPQRVAVDSNGNVYVADSPNHRIRKITPDGNVSTLAGNATAGFNNATGTAASFDSPMGIAVDKNDNIYVADNGNHSIRKIISSTGVVSTLAGSTAGFEDGTVTNALFNYPKGVAVDKDDNVYVADSSNHRIRKITPDGNVSTLAGSGTGSGGNGVFADGTGATASFNSPMGIAVDSSGNVYVADTSNNRIRKIISSTGVVTTLAGSTAGFENGTVSNASFNAPGGVTVDSNGNIYVADIVNHSIRKITSGSTKLSGTPTAAGVHNISLILSDGTDTIEHNFTITVAGGGTNNGGGSTGGGGTNNGGGSTTPPVVAPPVVVVPPVVTPPVVVPPVVTPTNPNVIEISKPTQDGVKAVTVVIPSVPTKDINTGQSIKEHTAFAPTAPTQDNTQDGTTKPTTKTATYSVQDVNGVSTTKSVKTEVVNTYITTTDKGLEVKGSVIGSNGKETTTTSTINNNGLIDIVVENNVDASKSRISSYQPGGDIDTKEDGETAVTFTETNSDSDGLERVATAKADGSVEHAVKITRADGTVAVTKAVSDVQDSRVIVTDDKKIQTVASVLNGETNVQMLVQTDSKGERLHVVSFTDQISGKAVVSAVTSSLDGTSTSMHNDAIETSVQKEQNGLNIRAVANTKLSGETATRFEIVNIDTGEVSLLDPTLDESTPFEADNKVFIENDSKGDMVIRIQTKITREIKFR